MIEPELIRLEAVKTRDLGCGEQIVNGTHCRTPCRIRRKLRCIRSLIISSFWMRVQIQFPNPSLSVETESCDELSMGLSLTGCGGDVKHDELVSTICLVVHGLRHRI